MTKRIKKALKQEKLKTRTSRKDLKRQIREQQDMIEVLNYKLYVASLLEDDLTICTKSLKTAESALIYKELRENDNAEFMRKVMDS